MQLSAIMVTGHKPERRWLALLAIDCFRRQTFPAHLRELVIINTGQPLECSDENIREFLLEQSSDIKLGDLRNHAFGCVRGEWMIQWDDDDWHHPQRCDVQMAIIKPAKDKCVLLESQIRCDLFTGEFFKFTCRSGIVGTILHHRDITWRYPSLPRAEDFHFAQYFIKRKIIQNRPELYCRVYHADNTWDRDKIICSTENQAYPSNTLVHSIWKELETAKQAAC